MKIVLLDINVSDSTQDIARKANDNFRRISGNMSKLITQIENEASGSVQQAVSGAVGEINTVVSNAKAEIQKAIDDANSAIDVKIEMALPPVNSYLIADADPTSHYKGTTWAKQSSWTSGTITSNLWKRTK